MFYFVVKNQTVTLGTFNPRQEPYTHKAEEYTTPTGIVSTGSCSSKSKIIRPTRHKKVSTRRWCVVILFQLIYLMPEYVCVNFLCSLWTPMESIPEHGVCFEIRKGRGGIA